MVVSGAEFVAAVFHVATNQKKGKARRAPLASTDSAKVLCVFLSCFDVAGAKGG